MKTTFSKILVVICILALTFGSAISVSAAEKSVSDNGTLPAPDVKSTKNTVTNVEPKLTQVSADYPLSKGVDIEAIKKGLQSSVDSETATGEFSVQTLTDPYEPNDSDTAAAPISYNQNVYANIGTSTDQDWYSINLTASSDPNVIVAFLLKNIPAGTDYDLYVFDPNFNYAASENTGNADERLYIDVATSGTWYVVVVPYSGYNDNENYRLFVGDAWQNGQTSWLPTNLTFNFTSSNVGTVLPYQTFDLTNNSSIPDSAVVKEIMIDSAGVGNWGNQHKYIYSPQTGQTYQTFVALDYVLDLPPNTLSVKQAWKISTMIETLYTYTAQWKPNILFTYKYVIE